MSKKITEIKVEKIDSRDFIDEEIETLEKYTDKKTGRVLGYYKPEIYYAPHNAERITEEQFFKNLGIKKTKNNFEKIKTNNIDEMAEYIHNIDKALYKGATIALRKMNIELTGYDPVRSKEAIKTWLLQEVEEWHK